MPSTNRLPEIIAELPVAVRAALMQSAQLVVQSAQDRVPVETGRLKDAIHVELTEEGVAVLAGDHKVFYGNMVEHGTVSQPAHPFLVPALEENRATIEAMVAAAIRKAS